MFGEVSLAMHYGHPTQVLRGVLRREERYRARAAYERWAPLPVQRAIAYARGASPFRPGNKALNAIFIHIPKTGGTSVRTALGMPAVGHAPLIRYAAADKEATQRAFKFAVVRNPWARFYSAWAMFLRFPIDGDYRAARFGNRYLRPHNTFEEFVLSLRDGRKAREILDYVHFLPQVHYLRLPGTKRLGLDFIGRFEQLNEAYRVIAARLGSNALLPQLNRGAGVDYRSVYTISMRNVVASLYAEDIQEFGYAF